MAALGTFDNSPLLIPLLQAVAVVQHKILSARWLTLDRAVIASSYTTYTVSSFDKTMVDHGLSLFKQDVRGKVTLVQIPRF